MVEFRNTDNLVANPTWNIIVQKTGYLAEAGKCLVMAAVIEGPLGSHRAAGFVGQVQRASRMPRRIKTWMEASANQRVASMR